MFGNNIFTGLEPADYSDTLGLCVNWYEFELALFAGADKEDRMKSAYYNICNLNCFDLEGIDRVMQVTSEARTVGRLQSIYQTIRIRLGDKKIKQWQASYVREILGHPNYTYTKRDTSALLRRHPYAILIPLLTMIFMKDHAKKGLP